VLRLFNRKKKTKTAGDNTESEPSAPQGNWQALLNDVEPTHDGYVEAITALNVRMISELAPLICNPKKYESCRLEALRLASAIQQEPYRSYAFQQVESLFRQRASASR
jgi:hypothetical protein